MQLSALSQVRESSEPLQQVELDTPRPAPGEVLLKVRACGVCHTELDEIEGRAPPPHLPVIPGHQAVAEVVEATGISPVHRPETFVGATLLQ